MRFFYVRDGISALILLYILSACACMPNIVTAPFEAKDLKPACLKSWGAGASRELVLSFDESVSAQAEDFAFSQQEEGGLSSGIIVETVSTNPSEGDVAGARLILSVSDNFEPGVFYAVSGIVYDAHGNATSFTLPFWGFNPEPADVLINEALTEGSEKHPDALELFVRTGGNLAGLALFIGSCNDFDARYVFPSCKVSTGEYLVLHLKPEGLATELDELGVKDSSGGLDASSSGRDFWYRNTLGASLPGKNGVVLLYRSPNGDCMDALVYSERTSESDQKYGGFGTAKLQGRVAAAVAAGAWKTNQPLATPEDAARSPGATSTRTLCRSSGSVDSDTGSDWHIAPSKGSSLGAVNGDEAYEP